MNDTGSIKIVKMGAKFIKFSGGELHTTLDNFDPLGDVESLSRIQSSDDLVALLMTTEVTDRLLKVRARKKITIPYLPYARQDRVTEPKTAFSLKVFAKLINDLHFDEVVTLDAHSDVAPALINNLRVVTQADIIARIVKAGLLYHYDAVLCPDQGAYKKSFEIAKLLNYRLIVAQKTRDVRTGEITSVRVPDEVHGKRLLIVDDICDGGRTFEELGKAAWGQGASAISLYVTHGIFSRGLGPLAAGHISRVYTTDAFMSKTVETRVKLGPTDTLNMDAKVYVDPECSVDLRVLQLPYEAL